MVPRYGLFGYYRGRCWESSGECRSKRILFFLRDAGVPLSLIGATIIDLLSGSATRIQITGGLLSLDVMNELINSECLIGDYVFDKISNRNDTDYLLAVEHRQMPHAFFVHDRHTLFD